MKQLPEPLAVWRLSAEGHIQALTVLVESTAEELAKSYSPEEIRQMREGAA